MLAPDDLLERRAALGRSADLQALLATIAERVAPLRARPVAVPALKAMLTADGGVCPQDGTALAYDPWSPSAHRCPRCGAVYAGERHDRAWAKFHHLWLAERAADFAALAALGDDEEAGRHAAALLRDYGERYFECENEDNVLGPTRLFFSTYLESIWVTSYLAAAQLLRAADLLDEDTAEAVSRVADEAAALIGEFDEGFSNRQTWHDAALAAIAVWFEDEDLAARAVEGETGLLAHLARGFGEDGMWYEGENYHLFALRGLLTGLAWARLAGVEPAAEPALAARIEAALRAPTWTALPDFTFPARKDSRFGVSLAQPMYLELWEAGLGMLPGTAAWAGAWLRALYAAPAPGVAPFESYLHDAHRPGAVARARSALSWWGLLTMPETLAGGEAEWRPASVLLPSQGVAVLREGGRYASLECGAYGGGHGHPDRLHLTLFADGVHWLPDFGTGSYVSRDLFWYRSTLAHNAPRLDGRSQPPGDARCVAFDAADGWAWVRGRYGDLVRTLVAGPDCLVDVVECASEEPRTVELPWHFPAEVQLATEGRWEPATIAEPTGDFVHAAERFVAADASAPLRLAADRLAVTLAVEGELLRARAPGVPGREPDRPFFVCRAHGAYVRFVAVITAGAPARVAVEGERIAVEIGGAVHAHRETQQGWSIDLGGRTVALGGLQPAPRAPVALVPSLPPPVAEAEAPLVAATPALDGSLEGFELSRPLVLDHEDQYRRSELPYAGADELSATAWINWEPGAVFVAVEVTKPARVFLPPDAPALRLDNEPDEIHSDGVQLYLQDPERERTIALLLVPDPTGAAVRVRPVASTATDAAVVSGAAWCPTPEGYRLTVGLDLADWPLAHDEELYFDLVVNEMRPGRLRRAGQLVWSGGGGWVWLRGDRQPAERFGRLRLVTAGTV